MPHILLGCAKLAALLRYPAGMWEAVHSFSLLFPILAETEARACDMMNKKRCLLEFSVPSLRVSHRFQCIVFVCHLMHLNEAQ